MKLTTIYDNLLYETQIKPLIENDRFYSLVKDYYIMEGDYRKDANHINELYNTLNEDGDFDPFSHGESVSDETVEIPDNTCILHMSKSNSKLDWPYLSLPAGYTCPMATVCKSYAAKQGQKFSDGSSIKAGSEREYQCYAARQQAQYSDKAGKNAFSNLDLLTLANKSGGIDEMANLILTSLEHYGFDKSGVFRIHEGGDFYSDEYFKAWIKVCNSLPSTIFYTHTTSIDFWLKNVSSIPKNMRLIASIDKNNEELIMSNNLRYAKVVGSIQQAIDLKLHIDYDDSIAAFKDESFALLIHGGQPKGSDAGKDVSKNRKDGSYDKLKQHHKQNKWNRLKLANTRNE